MAPRPFLRIESENAPPRRSGAGVTQSRPDLAMAFTMEPAGGEYGADLHRERVIGHRAGWPAPPRWCFGPRGLAPVNSGTADPPHAADRREAIRPAVHRRDNLAHGLSLRRAKGRWASRIAIFSCNRSRSISAAPSFGLQAVVLQFFARGGFRGQRRLAGGEKGVTPPAQRRRCHTQGTGDGLEVFATQ